MHFDKVRQLKLPVSFFLRDINVRGFQTPGGFLDEQ